MLLINSNYSGPEGLLSGALPFASTLPLYLLMGTSYLGGLAIYIARIPERFKPGWFDIIVKKKKNITNIRDIVTKYGIALCF
jgi:hypothetical protein